jgi:protein-S-isoprenylcysteine O-methyltransferase
MAIRWAAILTLGRFFTVDVAVHPGHRVIDRGPYRHVRHPSYSGLLLALLGVGLSLGDGAALLVLLGPCLAGLWWRISEEEKALRKALVSPTSATVRAPSGSSRE